MRKTILVMLVLFFFGGFVYSNGNEEKVESNEKVLTYIYWGSPAEDMAIKKALSAFEKAHPGVRVEPMFLPGDIDGSTYNAKMKALAAAGTLPDVGYFRPEEFGNYAENGFFLQLDDLMERDNMVESYIPQTWLKIDGKTYGAYTAAECQVLWYNKKVLKDAGIPLPPTDYTNAWSWDEFVMYLKQITIDKDGKHPDDAGFDPKNVTRYGVSYDLWSAMYYPTIWGNGGGIIGEDGKTVLIDKPETIEAFERLSDLIHVDNVMPLMIGGTNISPSIMMANEQLGFWVTGQWTLLELGGMDNIDLGVAALPIMKKPAQIYLSGVNVVFKDSKHLEEAWELQKWMMDPDKTLDLYTSGLWMPTKKSYYTSEKDLAKWLDNDVHPDGYREAVVNSMQVAVNEPIKIKNINQIWGDYLNGYIESIWIGSATAEEALTEVAEKIRNSGLLKGNY